MENKRYERTNRLAEAPEMTAREADEAFAVCVETVKRNMAYFGRILDRRDVALLRGDGGLRF